MRGIGMWANDSRRPFPVMGDPHEAGVQTVLHVALQDAVLDQHCTLGGIAFVVYVERAAPLEERAIIHHRHARRRHPLSHAAVKVNFPCG